MYFEDTIHSQLTKVDFLFHSKILLYGIVQLFCMVVGIPYNLTLSLIIIPNPPQKGKNMVWYII